MIKVDNLIYTYSNSLNETLKNISFDIPKGSVFGFLGPSGAGKTTTQKLITGLLKDYQGSVLIDDKERSDWDNSFYENIGVVFEFPNLYLKLTGHENLKLFGSYYKRQAVDINEKLKKTGIYDSMDKKVEEFSKGMKVRLNFIRALVHDPDILFLDEPISGLDPTNGMIIKNMIENLRDRGKTIFLTTHNMTVAEELCDKVAFIVDGRLPVIDTPNNLMVKYGKDEMNIEYFENDNIEKVRFSLSGVGNNETLHEILRNKKIRSIHTREASLEEIFIEVTGRGLE